MICPVPQPDVATVEYENVAFTCHFGNMSDTENTTCGQNTAVVRKDEECSYISGETYSPTAICFRCILSQINIIFTCLGVMV